MITFELQEKQFRVVTLEISSQDSLDMLEIICDAVLQDKVTATSQQAAKQIKVLIDSINEEQQK